MAKVQAIGAGEGGLLEVADPKPYIDSGKYQMAPQAGGSLAGTLPQERTLPSSPAPQQGRGLPTGSLETFKGILNDITRSTYGQGQSASQVLQNYSQKGLNITTPQAINSAINLDTESSAARIGDIYTQTTNLIKEQEQRRQAQESQNHDWAKQMFAKMPDAVFGAMTPQDFSDLKSGNPSSELIKKVQDALVLEQQQEQKPVVIGTDAKGHSIYGLYNASSKKWEPTNAARGGSAVSSGSDGGGGGFTPSFTPGAQAPVAPKQTFEQYLTAEQNKAGQSFGAAKIATLKKEFEKIPVVTPTPAVQNQDLSMYSFAVRQVLDGKESASALLSGGTAGERKRYQQELEHADKRGLITQTYSTGQEKFISSLNEKISKNDTYKKTNSMQTYANNVTSALSSATGVGDIAAINQFQKVIDEGAVTRDQDVKLIQGAQSLMDTLKTKIKKLEKGEALSPTLRQQMRTTVDSMYASQIKALNNDPYVKSQIKEAARNRVKPEDTIIGEFGTFQAESQSSGSADSYLKSLGL